MTSFAEVFANADTEGFGPRQYLPDGKYVAEITHANSKTSKNGKPKFGFLFKATADPRNGEHTGGTVWLNQVFTAENETARNIFARVMGDLGITGQMLDADAEAAVQTAVGQVWTIEVKTKGEFTNVYLGKRQGAPAPGGQGPAPAAAAATAAPAPAPVVEAPAPAPAPAAGDDPWDI